MKGAAIFVVSLDGVNFRFWSHLGCSGQNAIIFRSTCIVLLCVLKLSLSGIKKKLGPCPDWSPFGM